jgi:hypothetical protein
MENVHWRRREGQGFSIISSALLFLIKKGRVYIGFRV